MATKRNAGNNFVKPNCKIGIRHHFMSCHLDPNRPKTDEQITVPESQLDYVEQGGARLVFCKRIKQSMRSMITRGL